MKSKKIMSMVLAFAIMATFMVLPASAGKLAFIPGSGSTNYRLKVTASASVYAVNYPIGSTVTLKNGLPGNNVSISSSGRSAVSGKILTGGTLTPKLNDSNISTGNFQFDFMSGTDKLLAGNIGLFKWVGYIEFNDKTKHPKDDLGLDLNNLVFASPIEITNIVIEGQTLSIGLIQSVTGVVETTSNSQVYTSGQDVTLLENFGGGRGLTRTEQQALVAAKDFTATVTLSKALTEGAASFTFSTSNIQTAIPAYIFTGANTVKFSVPKEYIYDADYGILFSSLRVTGPSGYDYTNISLDYTDGSTTTNNNNNNNNNKDDEAVDEFIINYGNVTLNVGSSVNLKTNYSNVTWRSSSSSTIRVFTNGKITALKTGTATITGTNANNDTVTCRVTAINSSRPATSAKFSVTGGTCYVGLNYSLAGKLSVGPSNYTDKITWTSSDTNIATVNSLGRVTIHDVGVVTIVATTSSGRSSTMKLKCNMPSISLARSSTTLSVGGTFQISAAAKPGSATLTYNSTNENVATVSKTGRITAVGRGTARITVATNKGAGASRTFTVTVN